MSLLELQDVQERSRPHHRGPYRPSIIGFVAEYHAAAPLCPLKYSALIPDSVLSYSSDARTHFDLVILRFGRSEDNFHTLAEALKTLAGVSVQDFKVFKNGSNANRFHYVKTVIFPKKATHHGLRKWNVVEAAKGFHGMYAFLKCLEENDVTLVGENKWSSSQSRRATRLLSKYRLDFVP